MGFPSLAFSTVLPLLAPNVRSDICHRHDSEKRVQGTPSKMYQINSKISQSFRLNRGTVVMDDIFNRHSPWKVSGPSRPQSEWPSNFMFFFFRGKGQFSKGVC